MSSIWEIRQYLRDKSQFKECVRLSDTARVGYLPHQWQSVKQQKRLIRHPPQVTLLHAGDDPGYRVVYEYDQLCVFLWVPAEDVLIVARERTLVHREPGPRSVSGEWVTGVELWPGCLLQWRERSSRWIEIRGNDDHFFFTGWIPGDALGKIFVPEDMDPFRPTCRINAIPNDPDVELLETRESGVLGVFPYSRSGAPLQLLGPPARGVAPVHYQGKGFQATGFMEQLYILPAKNVRSGFGVGCGPRRNSVFMLLPAGTCLYSDKNGAPVGVLLGDRHAAVTGLDDGWWHVPELYSPWRLFDLWVQDDGPAPSRGHRMNDRPVVYRHLLSYQD